jgi:hypothetical protein
MARITPINAIGRHGYRRWSIDGIASGLTLLWGGPGVGKSFLAISMAVSVATGRPWIGRRTCQGPVVYIAGEGGEEAVAHRVRAALAEWTLDTIDDDIPLYIITPGINLVENGVEFADLVGMPEALEEKPQLVIVDTLSRCFVGDENKQEYMSGFVKTLDHIRDRYRCDIIVIHHANKQKELRGSSVLFGAVDVCWEIKPGGKAKDDGKMLRLVADKLRERDAEEAKIRVRVVKKPLFAANGKRMIDEFGDRQTTLVVKPTAEDIEAAEKLKRLGLDEIKQKKFVEYEGWFEASGMKKADFNAALSFILTYPGKWGIMRGLKVGTFIKAQAGVENQWGSTE